MAQRRATDWVTLLGAASAAYIASSYHLPWWEVGLVAGGAALGLDLLGLGIRTLRKRTGPKIVDVDDDTFVIAANRDNDTFEKEVLELDTNLSYRKALNHFRIHRQFDIYVSDWEYEYVVSPTGVSARLLQFRSQDPGEDEKWMVRDGVVQEADMRAAWAKKKYTWDDVEEKIAKLKLETEWCVIPPLYWAGASYFIMAKKLPQPDSRRYFRQELERLRRGLDLATHELAKLNYKQTEDGGIVPLVEPEVKASDEQWSQFWETVPTFGITRYEFQSSNVLSTLLKKLLAD
jgi:hypothetical protein